MNRMMQRPYDEYMPQKPKARVMGATPVDANNLQAVVGQYLWMPANSEDKLIIVYDSPSVNAKALGSTYGTLNGNNTGLYVNAIAKDENGNSWFQVDGTDSGIDPTGLGGTYNWYVPAEVAAIPLQDVDGSTGVISSIQAGAANSSPAQPGGGTGGGGGAQGSWLSLPFNLGSSTTSLTNGEGWGLILFASIAGILILTSDKK